MKDYGGSYQYPDFPLDSGITPSDPSFHGNCQWKAVTNTAYLPSLSETAAEQCNCSICTTNGYLWAYAQIPDVVFHSGEDSLATYTFNRHQRLHKFCQRCGSSILVDKTGAGMADLWMNVIIFSLGECQDR
ncbi:hypothetical protein FIBSPDRAFT_731786 [Athelia psychrophila]|uniref:CENP-V/GFA domain-containing protein n=1 Tax=Athelia psychrophila TaxID=1759441 RepID=A0A166Q3M5_9AGAM|nr:hypothetical protein FIBSPDRAFT_731786 [Fibularhizoctonia sp. CBS 109695]